METKTPSAGEFALYKYSELLEYLNYSGFSLRHRLESFSEDSQIGLIKVEYWWHSESKKSHILWFCYKDKNDEFWEIK